MAYCLISIGVFDLNDQWDYHWSTKYICAIIWGFLQRTVIQLNSRIYSLEEMQNKSKY